MKWWEDWRSWVVGLLIVIAVVAWVIFGDPLAGANERQICIEACKQDFEQGSPGYNECTLACTQPVP